jgi:hypothetical protein
MARRPIMVTATSGARDGTSRDIVTSCVAALADGMTRDWVDSAIDPGADITAANRGKGGARQAAFPFRQWNR